MGNGSRPLGRRRRRLYWTVALLAIAATAGTGVAAALWLSSRPEAYRPGEELAEITRRLELKIPEQAPRPLFADVTAEAGLDGYRAFAGNRTSQLPEDMGPGAAWGDHDGDGDDDLFLVSQGGPIGAPPDQRARSRLYDNLGDGTFAENHGFPETRILGMAAAWGDADGDGDLDLALSGHDELRLYRNDGGRFELDTAIASREGFWTGVSWSDFDLDGDLDLYVCGYVRYVEDPQGASRTTRQYGRAVPYTLNPASFEPAPNLLLRNDGPGGFVDVAAELGADNVTGRSLGALWHDLDQDGRPDLYVANDISDNALLINRAGGFEDVSHAAWVADYRGAMGLAAGDWNRDGDDDLFVTHWIAQENALYDSLLADWKPDSAGSGLRFMDVADQRGLGQIALQLVGWGTEFVDVDSDGWLDLPVANGSTFETAGRPRRLRPQPAFLFWNRRGEAFHDLAPLVPALSEPRVGRGLATSDYDGDGDVDLLLVDRGGGALLLRNDTVQGRRIGLRLARAAGRPVEGARVTARLASGVLRRTVGGVSYLSQSSRTLHLGLGAEAGVESLELRWPDGSIENHGPLEADALYELAEGRPVARRLAAWPAAREAPPVAPASRSGEREKLAEFWRLQRAAMDAMKIDGDFVEASGLFREALALDPGHEDSLYSLGNCLTETGHTEAALEQFAELMRRNSLSQRAHKRWGTLRAVTATSPDELAQAVAALERAAEINPEETGVSLVLGEVELLRGDRAAARQRLEWVVGSNPQSGEAYWVLAWLAWSAGDGAQARRLLSLARATRGEGWKPEGGAAEGETRRMMHVEATPFADLYAAWDGTADPAPALAPLAARLDERRSAAGVEG